MREPFDTGFSEQEDAMTNFRGEVINSETISRGLGIINYLSARKYQAVDITDGDNFYNALNFKVNVDKFRASKGIHGVML